MSTWKTESQDSVSSRDYANKDIEPFVALLIEPSFTILLALIESLDISDENKASDEVAEVLVVFLRAVDRIVPFLKLLITREVAAVDNPNTLFRRNSIASKMLTKFTADTCHPFLTAVLFDVLHSAESARSVDCELNPERGGSTDTAKAAEVLTDLCQSVVRNSISAVSTCPPELRDLCYHLKREASLRFGDKMGLSAVGGYLYLRFICPAMLAPERYALVRDAAALSKDARRMLMGVSKVIQTLANGILSFKEDYMRPMDAFLEENSAAFAGLLDRISAPRAPAAPAPRPGGATPTPPPRSNSLVRSQPAVRQGLLAIHHHLKQNLHKIGSVMAALESNEGLQSLKSTAEKVGWLQKRGGRNKAWKKRWFVLKGGQLVYFSSPQAGIAGGRIPLAGTRLETHSATEFTIHAEYRSYEMLAETEPELTDWVRALRLAQRKPARLPAAGGAGSDEEEDSALAAAGAAGAAGVESPREAAAREEERDVRGWLKKAGPKGTGWKRRWFILNGNLLIYFKAPNDSAPQGEIKIDDARIRSVDSTHFNIEVRDRIFYLQASTEREKSSWISTLERARVEFVKQLVSEAERLQQDEAGGAHNSMAKTVMTSLASLPAQLAGVSPKSSVPTEQQIWNIEAQEIVKEGVLSKQGGQIKTWKVRWFVLRGHQLYYYKSSADKEPLGTINLANSKITPTEKTSFEILTGKRNFFLRANTRADMDSWIDVLVKAAQSVSTVDKLQAVPEAEPALVPLGSNIPVSCEGYLQKQGGTMKSWRMRWFVLQGPVLSYYKDPVDPQAAGVIPLGNCSVTLAEEKLGKKFAFEIATRFRTYFLVAKDEFELAKWMRHIEQASARKDPDQQMSSNMKFFFRLNDILAQWETD